MIKKAKTAVLFFSRTAKQEAVTKTFNAKIGFKGNTLISQCFIDKTLKVIEESGLPVIKCFSKDQVGSDFGIRLANGLELVYELGYENVIVLGNDCPFVTSSSLLKISNSLVMQKMILGPTIDGGVYLIGINKACYNRNDFIELPWLNTELQTGLEQYAYHQSLTIAWLEEYFDIDGTFDFERLLKVLPVSSQFKIRLSVILYSFQQMLFVERLVLISKLHFNKLPLRAPPVD